MKQTTIQINEGIRKELEMRKLHPRESYNAVLGRMLETEQLPTLEQAFSLAEALKEPLKFSTKDVVGLIHKQRGK